MDILKHKQFGDTVTSYDALKTLALLLMFVDHIGVFFFPDEPLFRVLGRLCVPLWFFLIGYADSRHIPKSWLVWGLILAAGIMAFEGRVFPLNIIATMIVCRLLLDILTPYATGGLGPFAVVTLAAAILSFYTVPLIEYGALAVPLAMLGLAMRRGAATVWHAVAVYAAFFVPQTYTQGFTPFYALLFAALLPLSFLICWYFRPVRWDGPPAILRFPLQLMGRRTLEIYVLHLLLFLFIVSPYFGAVFYR